MGVALLAFTAFLAPGLALARPSDPPFALVATFPKLEEDEANVFAGLPNFLANELDGSGRVRSIVWSTTDPFFREALVGGKLKNVSDTPNRAQMVDVARAMGCEYVVVVDVKRDKGQITTDTVLLRSGRSIYKDSVGMATQVGGTDSMENTLRSLASTISARMAAGPLKDEKPQVEAPVTPVTTGQAPPVVTPEVVAPVVDNAAWLNHFRDLISAGKVEVALQYARDGVDAAPLEPTRRVALIDVYGQLGMYEYGASEARRSALIFPADVNFRRLAARYWTLAGKPEEAQSDLNEAVARNPDSPATRVMLAELAVANLQPDVAVPHLDAAIRQEPTAAAFGIRALAHAMLGEPTGATDDLAAAIKLDANAVMANYDAAFGAIDRSQGRDFLAFRDLLAAAAVRRDSGEVRQRWEDLDKRNRGRIAFMDAFPVPANRRPSYELLKLALSVQHQALLDAQTYLGNGDEDSLADARINLGEAMKRAGQAREQLATENPQLSNSEPKS